MQVLVKIWPTEGTKFENSKVKSMYIFFRLVNILQNNLSSYEKMWKIIEDMKIEFTIKFFEDYFNCDDIMKIIIGLETNMDIEGNSDFLRDAFKKNNLNIW